MFKKTKERIEGVKATGRTIRRVLGATAAVGACGLALVAGYAKSHETGGADPATKTEATATPPKPVGAITLEGVNLYADPLTHVLCGRLAVATDVRLGPGNKHSTQVTPIAGRFPGVDRANDPACNASESLYVLTLALPQEARTGQ